mgnify:CR=1 FL=1
MELKAFARQFDGMKIEVALLVAIIDLIAELWLIFIIMSIPAIGKYPGPSLSYWLEDAARLQTALINSHSASFHSAKPSIQ